MIENAQVIGRAKTVLLLQDDEEKAVISAVIVRRVAQRKRLSFSGKVNFSKSVKNHIRKVILPIVDSILNQLGLDKKNFEISAVNIGAASVHDIGLIVSGFSADASAFVAMLSAALQIPVNDDFVVTGHIASVAGDISAVKGIPAKVDAAQKDESIRRFLYPDLDDESLKILSPTQRDSGIEAIRNAGISKNPMRTIAVSDISQLIKRVFTEENIVSASLNEGFFDASMIQSRLSSPVQDAVGFIIRDNQKRFWDVLFCLLNEETERGKYLLDEFVRFFLAKKAYPRCFGAGLCQLMGSLSSLVRNQIELPILDRALCHDLISFAGSSDYGDVRILLNTIDGENIDGGASLNIEPELEQSDNEGMICNVIASRINEQALAQKFRAIDSARATFWLEKSRVRSYEELINIIQKFYIHLQRCTGTSPEVPDADGARSEVIGLLESTFYDKGGYKTALVMAKDGTHGGIRSILDMLTEQYKTKKRDAYINRVFKDMIADMDWSQRIECIRAVMKKIGPALPEEIRNQPPERFARNDETMQTIILTYVRNNDQFNQVLSRM